jgi:hypothetical protein
MQPTSWLIPRLWFALLGVALAALGPSGCSGANKPYPVQGRVFFEDGQPASEAAGGLVTFTSRELHVSAIGNIEPDGTYRLTMTNKNDGAIPGTYQVTVANPELPEQGDRVRRQPSGEKKIIDLRFADVTTSNLEVKVEAKSNDIPLTVKRMRTAKR